MLSTAAYFCSLSPVFKGKEVPKMDAGHSRHPAKDVNVFSVYFGRIRGDVASRFCFVRCFFFFRIETSHSEFDLSWQGLNLKLRSSAVYCKHNQKLYLITDSDLACTLVGCDLINILIKTSGKVFRNITMNTLNGCTSWGLNVTWKAVTQLFQSS